MHKRKNYCFTYDMPVRAEAAAVNVKVQLNPRLKKNLKIRWLPDKSLYIEIPANTSKQEVIKVLQANEKSLARQFKQLKSYIYLEAYTPEGLETAKNQLKTAAENFYRETSLSYKYQPAKLVIRTQKTRWGSCSSQGTISLNAYIMKLPPDLREYVFYHELVHLKYMNHQKEFWQELESLCPAARNKSKALSRYILPASTDF